MTANKSGFARRGDTDVLERHMQHGKNGIEIGHAVATHAYESILA